MPSLDSGTQVDIFATPWEVRAGHELHSNAPRALPGGFVGVPGIVVDAVEPGWWRCLITDNEVEVVVEVVSAALELTGEPDDDGTLAVVMVLLLEEQRASD